ncbi:methyltransferase, UbiE/COQ5 family [Verrucomicrobiia bacterium DG1235]|nr:methyltransferase, UbiE/COQ5 family [Verrucomicrobiae bacterium DG1235]
MDVERVRGYFNEKSTVQHYAKAVANVGLWESEKLLFNRYFSRQDYLLDLGCGAGRASVGLWEEGFERVLGADLAEGMVEESREIAECLGCPFRFQREDATALSFADGSFDGVVFAFNGLMQIPGRSERRKALAEMRRVLRPGGHIVFSTLDRDDRLYSKVFADADDPEHDLARNANLVDFGDRHFETEHGTTFMHVPRRAEVVEDLESVGLSLVEDAMRSELARESAAVRDFSEDCRMWVAR